jgi:hypothetical protein
MVSVFKAREVVNKVDRQQVRSLIPAAPNTGTEGCGTFGRKFIEDLHALCKRAEPQIEIPSSTQPEGISSSVMATRPARKELSAFALGRCAGQLLQVVTPFRLVDDLLKWSVGVGLAIARTGVRHGREVHICHSRVSGTVS